jgi:serine protease AprX
MTAPVISPAFEEVFRDSRSRQEAIVVFRPATVSQPRTRGRLRALDQRLRQIRENAGAQESLQRNVLEKYVKDFGHSTGYGASLTSDQVGSSILNVAEVEVTPESLAGLSERPEVLAVMPNQALHMIQPRSVDYQDLSIREASSGLTWGLERMEIPRVWAHTKGADINVAVLDTGVYSAHPALNERIDQFIVIDALGRRVKAQPDFDCASHGTHVCGTIAGGTARWNGKAIDIGVAPEARLLVAAVLMGDATLRTLLEGISWAVEQGADIISMSLGFTYYEPLFAEVFDMLINRYGVLPVVAIGNENHGNTSSPGNAYNALGVGAVEELSEGALNVPSFSSGASLVFPGTPNSFVTKPDVVAPGAQVLSCVPPQRRPEGVYDYSYMDGTSMATPHVAGVAALLMSSHPDAQVSRIIEAIRETAGHPAGQNMRPDNRWGFGVVRPVEALAALS